MMNQPSKISIWMTQSRVNFLLLAVVLVLIGIALAVKFPIPNGADLSVLNIILMLIGNVLAHASVNMINDYFDYKTKIDFETPKTPFSGGSGMLIKGLTKPKEVFWVGTIIMLIALAIGIYFAITAHWSLYFIIAIGALTIYLYNNLFAKILLGEFFTGLTLGTFVVLGTYIGLTATPDMSLSQVFPLEVVLISIPPGILTFLLLYLNEIPDAEADKRGGRFHLIILLGKKKAAIFYAVGLILAYLVIIITPIISISGYFIYLGLLTIPLAVKSSVTAIKNYNNLELLLPAMGVNILVVLVTDLLLAIGVFIG
ncbi:MAG TPA: prenyltransferase [Candidatus Kapabacteria bacterium]|nr:prenyltransferase [Candidatus Kapabacteria bacterium]